MTILIPTEADNVQLLDAPIESRPKLVVTDDGTVLSVEDTGPENAKNTIVMLHGLCLDKSSWGIQTKALTSRWGSSVRMISYDHRGHGKSSEAEMSSYRITTLASDLAKVMDRLHVSGNVTLAGHSMGGMTALAYMSLPEADRPVTPDSLVLVATAAGKLCERGAGVLLKSPAVNMLYQAVGHMPERVADAILHRTTAPALHMLTGPIGYGELRQSANATLTAASINRTHLRTKVGFLIGLKEYDAYAGLSGIAIPTTVFSGGKDFLTPRTHADDISANIPESVHVHYPQSGHMIQHEEPGAITSALERLTALSV